MTISCLGRCQRLCRVARSRLPSCNFSHVYTSRSLGLAAGFVISLLPIALGAQSPARPPLRWGGDAEGGAPFVEADPSDPSKVRGFDVEIARMIAHGLGREPQFVQVQWSSIEASLERGDFDLGMSGLEDRPELRARHAQDPDRM